MFVLAAVVVLVVIIVVDVDGEGGGGGEMDPSFISNNQIVKEVIVCLKVSTRPYTNMRRILICSATVGKFFLISELRNWFDNIDVEFFRVGINALLSRWQKCIDLHGDYVEK
ncbi:hypothetical protein PoB_002019900 [Plakobranchus ocellatus]|uniref:Uncharacterized protein n=1 Tax=Plakobranchus ocellatus TaxID=259542 RepID=A0AAV3ZH31_9GAST|nr:hypothetical protein PoB_002019900 [Plakobranchus ocellatus]